MIWMFDLCFWQLAKLISDFRFQYFVMLLYCNVIEICHCSDWKCTYKFCAKYFFCCALKFTNASAGKALNFDPLLNKELYNWSSSWRFNPLNPELNPICYLLAVLGAHHFLHVSRIRVKSLTFRWLMSYIYGAPILDVSRSHTTTQHSR